MSDTGGFRLPRNLDPRAREFTPGNPNNDDSMTRILLAPTHLYYPYPPPPPPIPPPAPYALQNDVVNLHAVPFFSSQPAHHAVRYAPPAYVTTPAPPQPACLSTAPTRALALSSVPTGVSETVLRRDVEVFGEVRGVQMERALRDGIVTVHFYDLRDSERALNEIREQHVKQQARLSSHFSGLSLGNDLHAPAQACGLVAGRAVWAHFVVPASCAVPEGSNQGTIVVFNLDPTVSSDELREIFQTYGPVKELRETPYKKHQRFVEFYDVRDAAKALLDMNGKEIHGKPVVIEFSRPGGFSKKFFNNSNHYNNMTSSTTIVRPPPLPSPSGHQPHRPNHHHPSPSPSHSHSKKTSKYNGNGVFPAEASWMSFPQRKVVKKNQNVISQGYKQQCRSSTSGVGNNKLWKNKQLKKFDNRFFISDEAMADSGGRDSRTTVMIKNIPNKYSQKLLLNMLDNHCINCNEQIGAQGEGVSHQPLSSYDFVYLPIDFNNKCNVGYGFVNMTSPQAAWRLYKAFHNQHWEVFNSKKICEVTYARVQGLEALKEHFKNSKFPCEMEHYLPVLFSPPRDGKTLTDPVPIVDHFTSNGRDLVSPAPIDGSDCSTTECGQSHSGDSGSRGSSLNDAVEQQKG